MDEFLSLARRVSDLERRMKGACRYGTVSEVDPEAGTIRLKLGENEDGDILSAAVPYAQTGGAVKFHNPPSEGQQMMILSPDGDLRQGIATPLGFSDENVSPSGDGASHVMTFGSVNVSLKSSSLVITVGSTVVTIGSSSFSVVSNRIDLN